MKNFFIGVLFACLWITAPQFTYLNVLYAKPNLSKPNGDKMSKPILTLNFTDLRVVKGVLYIAIFDNAKGFPSKVDQGIRKFKVEVKSNPVVFKIEGLDENKEIAISAYHDENNNGKMDSNWIGMPSEGFAASKNPKAFMGPPKFDDAKFKIKDLSSPTLELKMKYL